MPKPSAECIRLFADKGGDKVYTALVNRLRSRVANDLVFEDEVNLRPTPTPEPAA